MATINDYKLLEQKCIRTFELTNVSKIQTQYTNKLTDKDKARFGFYFFIIQSLTNFSELDDITEFICDTDFNSKFYCDPQDDCGIDAICFDDETNEIHIFNYKYRESFKPEKEQNKNETWLSSKFFHCLLNGDTSQLSDRMRDLAKNILECYESTTIWKTHFYIVSNENKEIKSNDLVIEQMKQTFDLQVHTIGLDKISPFLSASHKSIDATILMPTDAVMSFTEQELSSQKSYIVRMPLVELIRISNKDEELRQNYGLEDYDDLQNVQLEYDVLFDNVRGYILNSKFNANIEKTLDNDPTKFFFYNNGLTIVTENIIATSVNGGRKWKLEIKNYQVLNGGQTLRTIHNYNQSNSANLQKSIVKAEVLVRILNVTDPNLKNCIAEYTNSQNAIDLVDLKSLRKEQMDLESFFKISKILYTRKKGNTDISMQDARYQIGIQRLGQILTSVNRLRPEEASNKRREIFSVHYDELFVDNTNLISEDTLRMVETYHQLKSDFRKAGKKYTEQKAMYVLFIMKLSPNKKSTDAITLLDDFIDEYAKQYSTDTAKSRMLIKPTFRQALEGKLRV